MLSFGQDITITQGIRQAKMLIVSLGSGQVSGYNNVAFRSGRQLTLQAIATNSQPGWNCNGLLGLESLAVSQ